MGHDPAMNRRLPFLATLLGICGLIPLIACGIAALGLEGDRAVLALVAYGAVVLAFLGGVHWGFALTDLDGRGERQRLVLGVLPALVGWIALLLTIAVQAEAGLTLLLLGFLGITIVEGRARKAGLVPPGYMRLRYGLSAVIILVLAVVLFLRIIGAHITL
jgi:Protein of unknown function (DUF3429)